MRHIHAGHHLEQFAANMGCASVAGRLHIDLAGVGPAIIDELWHGVNRQ
jgi:hypothetical protein